MLTLIYMVFVIVASLVLGRLSDRLGRRKVFVFAASGLQAVAALLLAIVPDLTVAMIAAGMLGLGYGCFLSVDQALATQVLPDAADRGKDLGIMNIATAVPQAIAPLLGALVVVAHRRVRGPVFLLAAAVAFAGALAVVPVGVGALMALDLASRPARGCRALASTRRRYWPALTAATAAPRPARSACISAPALAPQRARHAATARRHADPRRVASRCACAE